MSVNMAYALITHLLLHLHQIMLVKHRIAAPTQYTLPFSVSPLIVPLVLNRFSNDNHRSAYEMR